LAHQIDGTLKVGRIQIRPIEAQVADPFVLNLLRPLGSKLIGQSYAKE
jgi:hypothetical protein